MKIVVNTHFNNLERFMHEVDRWDLDFRLMGTGGFAGRLVQLVSEDVLITYARFHRSLEQAGATPPGYRTFVIVGEACKGFWWRGHQVTNNDLLVFSPSGELRSASSEDFEIYTISVRTVYLDQLDDDLGLSGLTNRKREIIRLDSGTARGLRSIAAMIVKSKGGPLTLVASQRLVENLAVCTANGHTGDKTTLRQRHLAVDRVIEYVRSVSAPDSRLDGLCRISKTSERTLQYAFKERYGISPNTYVKRWKLNSARRCLLQSGPADVTVHEIAMNLGFFHQSQFATDYKNLFAELPSTTLKANS